MKHILGSSAFLIVNKYLSKSVGINAAIMLADLLSKDHYFEDDWFFNTEKNIENDTTLSAYQQRKALKVLKDKGFIDVKRKGIPAKLYFKINEEQVVKFLNNKEFSNCSSINKNKNNNTSPNTIDLRRMKFGVECSEASADVGMSIDEVNEFLSYWSEPNRSKTKMRFELEKTWDVKRRMQKWMRNTKRFDVKRSSPKSKVDSQLNEYEKGKSLLG